MSYTELECKNKAILKHVATIEGNTFVVIDKSIANQLGINEDDTILEESIVNGGVFLRLIRTDQT